MVQKDIFALFLDPTLILKGRHSVCLTKKLSVSSNLLHVWLMIISRFSFNICRTSLFPILAICIILPPPCHSDQSLMTLSKNQIFCVIDFSSFFFFYPFYCFCLFTCFLFHWPSLLLLLFPSFCSVWVGFSLFFWLLYVEIRSLTGVYSSFLT